MDIKIFFTILSSVLGLIAFAPYITDILKHKTKPHIFTWIIWAITLGTAAAGILYDKGGIGAVPVIINTTLTILVVILSIRYGTKNITVSDSIAFSGALLAIIVWWQLKNPLAAILMVSAIDTIGCIPTFRKSYEEPWTESLNAWIAFTFANGLAILALENYSLLTTTFLALITITDFLLALLLIIRRKILKNKIASNNTK